MFRGDGEFIYKVENSKYRPKHIKYEVKKIYHDHSPSVDIEFIVVQIEIQMKTLEANINLFSFLPVL